MPLGEAHRPAPADSIPRPRPPAPLDIDHDTDRADIFVFMGMLEDAEGAAAARQSEANRRAAHVVSVNALFRSCVSECAKEFMEAVQARGIPHDGKINFKRVWFVHVSIWLQDYDSSAKQSFAVFETGEVVCVDRNPRGRMRKHPWSNVDYLEHASDIERRTREAFTRALERRISKA